MGHHYIPQAYLRGFTEPGSDRFIWMYDKVTGRFSRPTVRKLAQQKNFYSQEVESELNRIIETPAHRVLNMLRQGETIGDQDRAQLAIYIGTMMWRVPHIRAERLKRWPQAIKDVHAQTREQLEEMRHNLDVDQAAVARRLQEIETADKRCEEEVPQEVLDSFRLPWPSEKMVSVIYSMNWRFGTSDGPSYYLTSDNPAFFFESYGLGRPESKLSFPISSDLALFGTWQTSSLPLMFKAPQNMVKEVNRRVASIATRFLFYKERQEWVATLARKQTPYLSRIQWS